MESVKVRGQLARTCSPLLECGFWELSSGLEASSKPSLRAPSLLFKHQQDRQPFLPIKGIYKPRVFITPSKDGGLRETCLSLFSVAITKYLRPSRL